MKKFILLALLFCCIHVSANPTSSDTVKVAKEDSSVSKIVKKPQGPSLNRLLMEEVEEKYEESSAPSSTEVCHRRFVEADYGNDEIYDWPCSYCEQDDDETDFLFLRPQAEHKTVKECADTEK